MRTGKKDAEGKEISSEQVCPNCGMVKNDWKDNDGEGFETDIETYCCEGCAENTGCTCTDENNEE